MTGSHTVECVQSQLQEWGFRAWDGQIGFNWKLFTRMPSALFGLVGFL
jgi:hypothetical protein